MKRTLLAFGLLGAITANSFAVNLIGNPGFETGSLPPWVLGRNFGATENWNVTAIDAHTGSFSATNVGNSELRQDFTPTLGSLITEVSVWIKNPDTQINFISLHYSDATEGGELIFARSANWEQYNVTGSVDPLKTLVAIGLWGYQGGGPAEDRSFYDDIVVNSSVPEPATIAALGLGVATLIRRRKRR